MSSTAEKPVGVVGLGLLGSAIVRCLLEGGLEVIGLDVDPGRPGELALDSASSPAELAARADRIVLCLPGSPEVEEVCDGILDAADRRVGLSGRFARVYDFCAPSADAMRKSAWLALKIGLE